MKKYITLFCAVLFALNMNSKAQDQIFTEEFKKNINARVDNGLIAGIVVGVITPEGTSYYSYGVKSLETKEPVDEHSVFEIGSNTKTFTGLMLADEVIKGELSLDDPLQKLLPEGITAPTRNGQTINLVHLANHTSALPRMPDNFTRTNPENPYADLTVKHTFDFINSYELSYDIGTKFAYSNLGMGLLGSVLAAKNNTDYEGLMLEKIARPLGMNDTRLVLTPDMERRLAKGHSMGVEVANWTSPGIAGAGLIRSTAADMLKYLAANMGIEKSDLYPAMQLAHKYSGSDAGNVSLGLGWILMNVEGTDVIWHDGGTGGYMSFMGFTKDGKKGVVVLTNSTHFPDDIGFHLLNPKSELANPKPSAAVKLNKIIEKDGLEPALKVYAKLKKNKSDVYSFASNEFVRLGYALLGKGKMKESLTIFKINAEVNPDDWNANDSYAEALMKNNENEKAIEYYKKSVELNPDNQNGFAMLKKLGADTESKKEQE